MLHFSIFSSRSVSKCHGPETSGFELLKIRNVSVSKRPGSKRPGAVKLYYRKVIKSRSLWYDSRLIGSDLKRFGRTVQVKSFISIVDHFFVRLLHKTLQPEKEAELCDPLGSYHTLIKHISAAENRVKVFLF